MLFLFLDCAVFLVNLLAAQIRNVDEHEKVRSEVDQDYLELFRSSHGHQRVRFFSALICMQNNTSVERVGIKAETDQDADQVSSLLMKCS